jgi:hypothetical protein
MGAGLTLLHLSRQTAERGLKGSQNAFIAVGPGFWRRRRRRRAHRCLLKASQRRTYRGLQGRDRLACARLRPVESVREATENLSQAHKFTFRTIEGIA